MIYYETTELGTGPIVMDIIKMHSHIKIFFCEVGEGNFISFGDVNNVH